MELFGILIASILGLFLAPLYCLLLDKVISRLNFFSSLLFWIFNIFIILFIVELCFVFQFGPEETRRIIGKWFFTIHSFLTFIIAPALGASLLLSKKIHLLKWYFVAPICWIVGISSILYQYFIAESLYGVDGIGGPYLWPW